MTTDPAAARYRRRRRWPVLVVIVVLLIGTGIIWFQALKPAPSLGSGCNQPGPAPTTAAPTSRSSTSAKASSGATTSKTTASSTTKTTAVSTTLGTLTDKNTLANSRPADPTNLQVSVYNAAHQRGMAKTLSDEMRTVGFASIDKVDDDPLYPAHDLRCVGEIRYGPAGVFGARTALLMMPCAQLVVDNRVDASVDIAIGALYQFSTTSTAVKTQLTAIKQADTPPAVIEGQTMAERTPVPIPPLPTATCPS
ncbi:MAG: envelope integrity protein Cei [Actinomycetota bacterium]|nr:envelope integrity protein Cei [Actinomycetota bacterium]